MGLTILAIPLIMLWGCSLKPYSLENMRCISFASARPYCFEQGSQMPEAIKYGSVTGGFALLYAGRLQIRRQRNGQIKGSRRRDLPRLPGAT